MGTGDIPLGVTLPWTSVPSRGGGGGVATLLGLLHATETGNKLRLCGPLARVRLYLYLTSQLEFMFILFFSQLFTEFIVKSFRNREFSILRISCSRSGRFYFRLRTEACADQPEPRDFCGRDLMSPESFLAMPADQKARRLWVRDWSLRACLHGVGDPSLVGLVSFVFTLWGTQNKRNLPHLTGVPNSM